MEILVLSLNGRLERENGKTHTEANKTGEKGVKEKNETFPYLKAE